MVLSQLNSFPVLGNDDDDDYDIDGYDHNNEHDEADDGHNYDEGSGTIRRLSSAILIFTTLISMTQTLFVM